MDKKPKPYLYKSQKFIGGDTLSTGAISCLAINTKVLKKISDEYRLSISSCNDIFYIRATNKRQMLVSVNKIIKNITKYIGILESSIVKCNFITRRNIVNKKYKTELLHYPYIDCVFIISMKSINICSPSLREKDILDTTIIYKPIIELHTQDIISDNLDYKLHLREMIRKLILINKELIKFKNFLIV